MHGVSENIEIQINLLKYLNKKYKVIYILLELGYSTSKLLNQYLASGNREILDNIFECLEGTYYWTNEQYNKWIDLYEYNQLLPEDEKIICVGVDVEHQYPTAIKYLNEILPPKEPPTEIQSLITELIVINDSTITDGLRVKTFANNFINTIDINRSLVEEYLGESLFDFEIVLNGISKLFEWTDSAISSGSKDYNIRDGFMYDTFVKLYSKLPSGKYYGHFGSSHITQKILNNTQWFATRLDSEGSPVKNKIYSIMFLYKNCRTITTLSGNSYGTKTLNSVPDYFNLFDGLNLTDITLFPLTGENSPFQDNTLFEYYQDESGFEFPVTEYFQSIILIQNGNAMTPLN